MDNKNCNNCKHLQRTIYMKLKDETLYNVWCKIGNIGDEKCNKFKDNTLKRMFDMDGNELKIGDIVLFATNKKTISRARITSVDEFGFLELHTLKKKWSKAAQEHVLLDKTYQEDK